MPTQTPTKAPTKAPTTTPQPNVTPDPVPMRPERLCPDQKRHITRTVEPLFP